MKAIFYFFIFLVLFPKFGISQPLISGQLITEKFDRLPVSDAVKNGEYDGSPYLIDTFVIGKLKITKEASYKMPMRYNIFGDVVDVKYKGRDMMIIPNDLIEAVEIAGYSLVSAQYEYDGKQQNGFLISLDTGSVNLLMKKNISFEDWRPARAQETGPKLAQFKEGVNAYFIQNEKKITQIKNVKDLPEMFPGNRAKVADYIKKNKTKLKEEKLKDLFQFYNGLGKREKGEKE